MARTRLNMCARSRDQGDAVKCADGAKAGDIWFKNTVTESDRHASASLRWGRFRMMRSYGQCESDIPDPRCSTCSMGAVSFLVFCGLLQCPGGGFGLVLRARPPLGGPSHPSVVLIFGLLLWLPHIRDSSCPRVSSPHYAIDNVPSNLLIERLFRVSLCAVLISGFRIGSPLFFHCGR